MKQEDLMPVTYEDVTYKWEPPKGDFIVKIQPRIAKQVNLCGYVLEFEKMRDKTSGEWLYPIYTLDTRKFPPKVKTEGLKSVLPEILIKLTNPLSPVVEIRNTEVVKEEPKVKAQTKTKGK